MPVTFKSAITALLFGSGEAFNPLLGAEPPSSAGSMAGSCAGATALQDPAPLAEEPLAQGTTGPVQELQGQSH